MSAPTYDVVTVDLSVANTELQVLANQPIESITVLQVDSPVVVRLGANRPQVPLVSVMQVFQLCPVLTESLFITNSAGVGSLVLFVALGGVVVQAGA